MFSCWQTRIWRVNDWQTCVGNYQPIKTRVLFTWFICLTLDKIGDASQHFKISRRGSQLSSCEGRFIYALQRYQKYTKENGGASGQTGFLPTLLFHRCLNVLSSLSMLYVSVTALNKSAMLQINVYNGTKRSRQHKANLIFKKVTTCFNFKDMFRCCQHHRQLQNIWKTVGLYNK